MFYLCLCFTALFGLTAVVPIQCSEEKTNVLTRPLTKPIEQVEDLLRKVGILEPVEVFFGAESPNILECLHYPDLKPRLFQVCTNHDLAAQCNGFNETENLALFDVCEEDVCWSTIPTEKVQCRLNSQAHEVVLGRNSDGWKCGLPSYLTHFFDDWNLPTWTAAIGGQSSFYCMTAFPNGTQMHWKFVCKNGNPQIKLRMKFPDGFLKDYVEPQCIIRDRCGGSQLFTSDAICFNTQNVPPEAETPMAEANLDLLLSVEEENDFSKGMCCYISGMLCILLLLFHFGLF